MSLVVQSSLWVGNSLPYCSSLGNPNYDWKPKAIMSTSVSCFTGDVTSVFLSSSRFDVAALRVGNLEKRFTIKTISNFLNIKISMCDALNSSKVLICWLCLLRVCYVWQNQWSTHHHSSTRLSTQPATRNIHPSSCTESSDFCSISSHHSRF